ncbi:hypothetical protein J5X98_00210 [Leptothermofonsia sichuanensis E412]|nr:hypothetical protein [Leptothermofonsia sichuanensis]QZZ20979.1 hypothetical protein J5X98_00210 [Leptothermofonsia sichuanensis E412]
MQRSKRYPGGDRPKVQVLSDEGDRPSQSIALSGNVTEPRNKVAISPN